MSWYWPEDYDEALAFLYAPLSSPFTLVHALTYHALDQPEYMEEPDWESSVRNSMYWSGVSGAAWASQAILHPGKYGRVSAAKAFEVAGKLTPPHVKGFAMLFGTPYLLYLANKAVAEGKPVEEQQSFWQVFSQGLTGTGPGVGGADLGF